MMKLIGLFFITAGWIVSLVPLILLTLSNLADGSNGLALCFIAIIIFISGFFIDMILEELTNKDNSCPYNEPFHDHHDGCPACTYDEIDL